MNSNNQKKLKVGIYDPYLDTLGGGERYILTVAETLFKQSYDVDLFWSGNPEFLKKAADRFSLDISSINIVPDIFNHHPTSTDLLEDQHAISSFSRPLANYSLTHKISRFINKIKVLSQYDVMFYLSDGSLPYLFSKNNIIHFQVPFLFNFSLAQKFSNFCKFIFIKTVVCNSKFTSNVFSKSFNHPNIVLYPPVDIEKFSISPNKENIILSVGRFDNLMNNKKQDILIQAFSQIITNNPSLPWKLVLAGGSKEDQNTNQYLKHLQSLSHNLPIEFMVNPSFSELVNIYSKSKIYWHAAGYNVDQVNHPENTEHFGIVVVEAMSAGLVPIVVNRGGLPEIITDKDNGFLWDNIEQLISKTMLLIGSPELIADMSNKSKISSQLFSKTIFSQNLLSILNLK